MLLFLPAARGALHSGLFMNREINFSRCASGEVLQQMASLIRPSSGYVGCKETILTALGLAEDALVDLRSVPLRGTGQRLLALRYLIENGEVWRNCFAYRSSLDEAYPGATEQLEQLCQQIESKRRSNCSLEWEDMPFSDLAELVTAVPIGEQGLEVLCAIARDGDARERLRRRLEREAPEILSNDHRTCDVIYLLSQDLSRLSATTVGEGELRYLIVADKGEMGVRAVREALAAGVTPVALYNEQDDADALSVRCAEAGGGFSIGLSGNFRETYANPVQIARRVREVYEERFGEDAPVRLAESALYPGYGPLAENTVAIQHFRRAGICFCGPSQDVVEQVGDKRKFRLRAQLLDPEAVTPGIVMDESDSHSIERAIFDGAATGKFTFPGRLKAANGGGGRGQVVIQTQGEVPAAVAKVLAEIDANGWDSGVMFEQNIPQTIHLEVQVVRDRFGNTRHFGMRDCTEQRASQKIQEEAPPALLKDRPDLEKRMCEIAVKIADSAHYVGACTVELMYKDGHFYLLEMNTRIQVEHPVTEEAHRIRRGEVLEPLNLVQLQLAVARGLALDFSQDDVVRTRVAREFRINAEAYQPNVKDSRDGKKGLFLPNSGVFDRMEIPSSEEVLSVLRENGISGVRDLGVRFDCGFEVGDELVNKDPTFGKLIVSVEPEAEHEEQRYELLRLASIEVLRRTFIEGRQVTPSGKVLPDRPFETNVADHIEVLESEMLIVHSQGESREGLVRHVGWLIDYLRNKHAASEA